VSGSGRVRGAPRFRGRSRLRCRRKRESDPPKRERLLWCRPWVRFPGEGTAKIEAYLPAIVRSTSPPAHPPRTAHRPRRPPLPILSSSNIEAVVDRILAGGIAGIPTDTVYGLAALATDRDAVDALIEAKGRDSDQPIALLFDSVVDVVPHLADPHALDAIASLWPGALTAVVRAAPGSAIVAPVVTEAGTIGIRKPDDPFARSVIRACGGVLAVSSANRHNETPAVTAEEVEAAFGELLPILDGGPRHGGIPSTVVDLTVDPPRVLREGAVDVSAILRGQDEASGRGTTEDGAPGSGS
jgi:L-threonylcarbamoyladenylate synthase